MEEECISAREIEFDLGVCIYVIRRLGIEAKRWGIGSQRFCERSFDRRFYAKGWQAMVHRNMLWWRILPLFIVYSLHGAFILSWRIYLSWQIHLFKAYVHRIQIAFAHEQKKKDGAKMPAAYM